MYTYVCMQIVDEMYFQLLPPIIYEWICMPPSSLEGISYTHIK